MAPQSDDNSAAVPEGSVTARDAGNEKSLKLRIPSSWVDGTKEDSGKVFAFVGAASIDMAERSDYRDPPAPPQEGFVRRLFFDMCDKDLKAGRAESSMLVNGQPLSESEMLSIVAYARRHGFLN